MKLKLLSLIALLITSGSIYAQNNNYVLNGKITELKDGDKVSLLFRRYGGNDTLSTAFVKDGRFSLKGSVVHPTYVTLHVPGKESYFLFVENAQMSIAGDSIKNANVKGSKSNEDFVRLENSINPIKMEMRKLGKELQNAYKQNDKVLIEQLGKELKELTAKKIEQVRSFAIANPNSYVSPVAILTYEMVRIDPVVYKPIYDKFSAEVKKSGPGEFLNWRIASMSAIKVGDMAPAISAKTPEGQDLSLAEVMKTGKLTLVDFWASWCGACRRDAAEIYKLYKQQYHAKGLNVIGVSLDKSEKYWKAAINKDKIDWYQVADLQFKGVKPSEAYGVVQIPATYLIDQNGKVVAKNPTIDELAKLFNQVLNTNKSGELKKVLNVN
ncbi:TlpA disulfide reductase family protein [Solitalea koreensis]|uniref:Peroxiredoxin n=1 Tax=Solitalea koreensis TaxID=543615 RepID=A0A521AV68_9SPHI|nr:TlpA disulfide reductase family protein [Solitalea koreensis]SMO38726.1 Peroxiredoxin [Solitalea koreensis]